MKILSTQELLGHISLFPWEDLGGYNSNRNPMSTQVFHISVSSTCWKRFIEWKKKRTILAGRSSKMAALYLWLKHWLWWRHYFSRSETVFPLQSKWSSTAGYPHQLSFLWFTELHLKLCESLDLTGSIKRYTAYLLITMSPGCVSVRVGIKEWTKEFC